MGVLLTHSVDYIIVMLCCQSGGVKGQTVAELQIHHVQEDDFRVYTIVAENSVSVAAKDIPLLHSQSIL